MTITLYYLIANGSDGSAWVHTFTCPDRRSKFRAADPDDDAWLGEGEIKIAVDGDGTVSDPEAGSEYWTRWPGHRAIDPMPR